KYFHFGTIIPNAFYIKAASSLFYSAYGAQSTISFIRNHILLISIALLSFSLKPLDRANPDRLVSGLLILFNFIFYLRVDTLQDIYNRFLFPTSIFFLYLSLPALTILFNHLVSWQNSRFIRNTVLVIIILFIFHSSSIFNTWFIIRAVLSGEEHFKNSPSLMQKEYRIAMLLKGYQNIKKVKIACGDSGVIPYFTEAIHLDNCGLNDRFIAKERDLKKLTDYYFGHKPDLVTRASNKDLTWVTYGHGNLGNFSRWSKDERWDQYFYIGTIKTSEDIYDLELFLRKDSPEFKELGAYLKANVVDGFYREFPISIGNYEPDKTKNPQWIARDKS
ncbi:hypothetical protein ACFL27_11275, partial [candidate division CSSED10-310 bacterium]